MKDDNNSVYLYITNDLYPSANKFIKVFSFPELGSVGVIDESNHNINVTVPFGTDITMLTPRIKISGGATISPSIDTPLNFTNPVTYVVTAENGLSQSYVVTVLIHSKVIYSQPDNSVEITAAGNISLQNVFTSASGNISNLKFSYNDYGNSAGHFIGVKIADQNTFLSYYATKPGLGTCGDTYESTGINAPIIVNLDDTYQYKQNPCTGPNLVLNPTHTYSVNLFLNQGGSNTQRFYGNSNTNNAAYLHIETNGVATLSSTKQITTFNFNSLSPSVTGVIDEVNHAVSLTVPFGINVTSLVPTITISSYASINPNINVAQNFTSPVPYTVTAENGSTQNYTVTVTVAPDPNIATRLKILTSPQTVAVNTASNVIKVESQNALGVLTNVASTTDVNLSSSSDTGLFASSPASGPCNNDGKGWEKNKIITISKGDAHRSFCYKDSVAGTTPTITVSADSLFSDSQVFAIN
jgi:hypothetical protein